MRGDKRLAGRKATGMLHAREGIDRLFDPGRFVESGLLAVSSRPEDKSNTPADSKIAGVGSATGV